jgi:hypothetical protein
MNVAFVIPKDGEQHNPLSAFSQSRIFPPVGLARMAGLAGRHGDVSIVDERVGPVQLSDEADIVVIFINSYNQQRAYTLANKYLARGIHVVFTGPVLAHTEAEARHYAHTLFIGSGEECMVDFLRDYRSGDSKPLYGFSKANTRRIAAAKAMVVSALSLAS